MDGAGEGQGRNDSSRRQEGISLGKGDPVPRQAQRSDGEEVRIFPLFLSLGVVTMTWKVALFRAS